MPESILPEPILPQTILLVVGGMHPSSVTGQIVDTIAADEGLSRCVQVVVAPQHSLDVLSAFALRQVVETAQGQPAALNTVNPSNPSLELIIWAFSAGCVGAAALATYWQHHRGSVLALFMVDGWGVPRPPAVPVHRLSHDRFTHNTSRWLGAGDRDFYADPAVPHLHLWQHPQTVTGWSVARHSAREYLTAAEVLCQRSREALAHPRLNINSP